jgi:hypothetical protein
MCAGGAFCGLVVCALCLSIVLSRMCRAVALPKGSETCLQVILFFAFLGIRSIVGVSFYSFLFFFLFSNFQICVLSMHSSRED